MGGVKSRNGRTHRIENNGVVSMRENTSDIHERRVSHTNFLGSMAGGEDRCTICQGATEFSAESGAMHVESDRKGRTLLYNAG